jgi:glutamate racemase
MAPPQPTIGIFDSGLGGLSVMRAVRAQLSCACIHYVADQAHVPYGHRSLEQVCGFAHGISEYLIRQGSDPVVVACNSASAAALQSLREAFPDVSFVGMEPALKPAASMSNSGTVGVLATQATFKGRPYASVLERFASNVQVVASDCPGLVQRIEAGDTEGPETRAILEKALAPMVAAGADSIVLGCTHFPFVIPLIESIVGPGVEVIDPSPAVALQIGRLLERAGKGQPFETEPSGGGEVWLCTTGDPAVFGPMASSILGEKHVARKLSWEGGKLEAALEKE